MGGGSRVPGVANVPRSHFSELTGRPGSALKNVVLADFPETVFHRGAGSVEKPFSDEMDAYLGLR